MEITKTAITVETLVNAPLSKVWAAWTEPEHIVKWNFASDDWHCPKAENDLRVGGKLKCTMAAKDGSMSFDFEGTYTTVTPNKKIDFSLDDQRKVSVSFTASGNETKVTETFDAENTNSLELQRNGWQAILNNFRKHAETI